MYATTTTQPNQEERRPPGIPQILIDEIDAAYDNLYTDRSPLLGCMWLDHTTGKCKHYKLRPQVCRDYKLGGIPCMKKRSEAIKEGRTL